LGQASANLLGYNLLYFLLLAVIKELYHGRLKAIAYGVGLEQLSMEDRM
jgi:hypothetical protein